MTLLLDDVVAAEPGKERLPSAREILILKHALAGFSRHGYAGTNLRALARSAGLTAPMVNYYFSSKEELFQRLAMVIMATVDAQIVGAVGGEKSFEGTLLAIIRGHLGFAETYPEGLSFLLALVYGPSEGCPPIDLAPLYDGIQRRVHRAFDRAVRERQLVLRVGITLREAIDLYEALVDSLVLRAFKARRFGKPAPDDRIVERRLRWLLASLGAHDSK